MRHCCWRQAVYVVCMHFAHCTLRIVLATCGKMQTLDDVISAEVSS